MSLNESIVEYTALEWFGELGYAVGHGPHLTPGEPAAERDSFGEVVLVGRLREAIRRQSSIIHARVPIIFREPKWPKLQGSAPSAVLVSVAVSNACTESPAWR